MVVCEQRPAGWRARLVGWEDALPGSRLAIQVMAGLVTILESRIDRILAKVKLVRRKTLARCLEKLEAPEVVAQDFRAIVDTLAVATVPAKLRTELAIYCCQLDYLFNKLLLDLVVPPPSMQEDLEAEAATEEEKTFLPPRC